MLHYEITRCFGVTLALEESIISQMWRVSLLHELSKHVRHSRRVIRAKGIEAQLSRLGGHWISSPKFYPFRYLPLSHVRSHERLINRR
jgi:hypothetical protein